jgi:hypothetical protein
MRQCLPRVAVGLLVTFVAGCGTLACQPAPVIVAEKEERSRLEMVPTGGFTSSTGRLEEVRAPKAVRNYWVRAKDDGTWYPISPERYRTVEVGDTVELCR